MVANISCKPRRRANARVLCRIETRADKMPVAIAEPSAIVTTKSEGVPFCQRALAEGADQNDEHENTRAQRPLRRG